MGSNRAREASYRAWLARGRIMTRDEAFQSGKNPRWNVHGLDRVNAEAISRRIFFGEQPHQIEISADSSDESRSIEESDPDFSSHMPPALEDDRYFKEIQLDLHPPPFYGSNDFEKKKEEKEEEEEEEEEVTPTVVWEERLAEH